MSAAIDVASLSKTFGGQAALSDVSFSVPEGAFACLVGPSGCGKTTLLRILAGLETPSSGQVLLNGSDATRLNPASRSIGVVFQSYALFPNLTAAQNIAFGLHGKDWPRSSKQARVDEVLALVGLSGLEKRKPVQLSGGQQQRVALARALAPRPRFLLLDEPLSALDPHVRGALRAELKDIQRRTGVTTVMVTHDQEEALALADLVVVLRAGRLEQAGSPRHLLEQPATPFVADFVANMNIIEARAESDERISIGATVISGVVHGLAPGAALSVAAAQGNTRLTDAALPAACPARVRAVEFAGRQLRVIARLEAGGTLIRAHAPLGSPVASGDVIGVAFDPQSLRVYAGAP